ncbi:ABC transporter permease [Mycoplasmatota bacterium WC30]
MKHFKQIIKNDFKNFLQYNILQIVLVLSILFAAAMAFVPSIEPLLFIYVTVFILPVIIFATSVFIESEERTLLPLTVCDCSSIEIIFAKIVSALVLLLIPFILYTLVMVFVLHMSYSIILFLLVYLLSAVVHILVGVVLAITSKSSSFMSVGYIAYIVIFSVTPIFYSSGLVPEFFQYVLIISPAYLSGVLFQEIILDYAFSSEWLIILSVLLPIAYIVLLSRYVIRPYFKTYLQYSIPKKGE